MEALNPAQIESDVMDWSWPVLLSSLLCLVSARKLPPIHWNSSNPIFGPNSAHIVAVRVLDQLSLICPRLGPDGSGAEWSTVWLVGAKEARACRLSKKAKRVGVCHPSTKPSQISIVFRTFTPMPNGMQFRPNGVYYFISTSSGEKSGLADRSGGLCKRASMRLRVKVGPRKRGPSGAAPLTPPPRVRKLDGSASGTSEKYERDSRGEAAEEKSNDSEGDLGPWAGLGQSYTPRAEREEKQYQADGVVSPLPQGLNFPDADPELNFPRDLPLQPQPQPEPEQQQPDFVIHTQQELDELGGLDYPMVGVGAASCVRLSLHLCFVSIALFLLASLRL